MAWPAEYFISHIVPKEFPDLRPVEKKEPFQCSPYKTILARGRERYADPVFAGGLGWLWSGAQPEDLGFQI